MKFVIATILPTILFAISVLASVYLSIIFALASIIFLGDIYARFREYLSAKNTLTPASKYRYLKLMRGSRCERLVAIAVFPNRREARAYYRSLGYRWYHLFPDGTFSKNSPFLKIKFYLGVVGITKRRN